MYRLLNASVEEIASSKDSFEVTHLGEQTVDSPLGEVAYADETQRISLFSNTRKIAALVQAGVEPPAFVPAGPRQKLYHDPSWTRVGIVTCGGICPGLNDVIKALVNTLWYNYGVRTIFGIPYGFRGLNPKFGYEPIMLNPDIVDSIHETGGSILGSSRGQQPEDVMVRALERHNINILFTIGGDGTQRCAHDIVKEVSRRNLRISVIGVPKTIDNDLNFMERTFGYETAIYHAAPAIGCAHNEAKGARNGIGLVRLMGRDSGFIAASATLANSVVNFCLVPEVKFELEGEHGLLAALERRLVAKGKHHAVVVVAEGAGQDLLQGETAVDASGNKLHKDIGLYLKERFTQYLTARNIDHTVKYFDPSYMIRSVAAQGTDAVFCLHLAQNAVHVAMAGMTDVVVGDWHNHFVAVPIPLAVRDRRKINPRDQLWQSVLMVTRQEEYFHPKAE